MSESKNLPVAKFRSGAITATIWKNTQQTKEGKDFDFNSVNLERSYKDKNDEWQKTGSLRLNDLPRAQLVMAKAYEYLALTPEEEKKE